MSFNKQVSVNSNFTFLENNNNLVINKYITIYMKEKKMEKEIGLNPKDIESWKK
jgi:hypothetical protein